MEIDNNKYFLYNYRNQTEQLLKIINNNTEEEVKDLQEQTLRFSSIFQARIWARDHIKDFFMYPDRYSIVYCKKKKEEGDG